MAGVYQRMGSEGAAKGRRSIHEEEMGLAVDDGGVLVSIEG